MRWFNNPWPWGFPRQREGRLKHQPALKNHLRKLGSKVRRRRGLPSKQWIDGAELLYSIRTPKPSVQQTEGFHVRHLMQQLREINHPRNSWHKTSEPIFLVRLHQWIERWEIEQHCHQYGHELHPEFPGIPDDKKQGWGCNRCHIVWFSYKPGPFKSLSPSALGLLAHPRPAEWHAATRKKMLDYLEGINKP